MGIIYLSSHFSVGNMERNMNTFFLLTCFMLAGLYFGSANCDCDSTADCPAHHICVISGTLQADDKCVHIDDASYADALLAGLYEPLKWIGVPGTPFNVGQASETIGEGFGSLFGKRSAEDRPAGKRSLLLKKILRLNRNRM